jgi:hypothetical protein
MGQGQPALVTEVPMPAKAGATVVTFLRPEEGRGTAMHRQQGWRAPTPQVLVPLGSTVTAAKKRASKRAPEKPLVVEPGPATVVGRRAGVGHPTGVAAEPSPRKWCPLYETSLHYVTTCRYIGHLVEIRRECLAKRAAVGAAHGCYECGQDGHWSHDCAGKVPLS